jgi:opacity protein-like surface antigen
MSTELKILAAVAAALLAAPVAAFAGTGDACKMGLSVAGGYTVVQKDAITSSAITKDNAAPAAALTIAQIAGKNFGDATTATSVPNAYGKGAYGEAGLVYYITDGFSLGATFGYLPKVKVSDSDNGFKSETKSYNGMLRARYEFITVDSSINPFVEIAGGVEKNEFKLVSADKTNVLVTSAAVGGTTPNFTLAQTAAKIKKTGARFEAGVGVEFAVSENAKLGLSAVVGYSQSMKQKDADQFIAYATTPVAAAGTDAANVIKSIKIDSAISQMFKASLKYVF